MKSGTGNTFYVYGKQPVLEALKAGKEVEKIWLLSGGRNEVFTEIQDIARRQNIPVQYVPAEKLQYLVKTDKHQGIAAYIAQVEYHEYTEVIDEILEAGERPFVLLLDGVTDVRNLGAIARTAYGMGIHALILPTKNAAPINSETIKSSAGAIHHLKVCRTPHLLDVIRYLQQIDIPTVALDAKATMTAAEAKLALPLAVIAGDEHKGVDRRLLKEVDKIIRLPIEPGLDSYNVSVAAAMLLYEVKREG